MSDRDPLLPRVTGSTSHDVSLLILSHSRYQSLVRSAVMRTPARAQRCPIEPTSFSHRWTHDLLALPCQPTLVAMAGKMGRNLSRKTHSS